MPIIIWNGHFSRRRHLRSFAARQIIRHYHLRGLASVRPKIRIVVVRYVGLPSFLRDIGLHLAQEWLARREWERPKATRSSHGGLQDARWRTLSNSSCLRVQSCVSWYLKSDEENRNCAKAFSFLDCSLLILQSGGWVILILRYLLI